MMNLEIELQICKKETENMTGNETTAPVTEPSDAAKTDTVSLTQEEFDQVKAHIETLQKEKEEAERLAREEARKKELEDKYNSSWFSPSSDDDKKDDKNKKD